MDWPDRHGDRADASRLGWDAVRLDEGLSAIRAFGSIAAIVVQHGRVIAQTGDPARKVRSRTTFRAAPSLRAR